MGFTSEVIFLKWSTSTKKCFYIKQEGYQGYTKEKPASYSRSLYDGSLQRVYGPVKVRRFMGIVIVQATAPAKTYSDGTDNVAVGSITDLISAWEATNLECLSFEDSAYWEAEWDAPMVPEVTYDPLRNYADVQISLVER